MDFTIKTEKSEQIIDMTSKVYHEVGNSRIKEEICLVYVAHATAAIISESYDPNVGLEILDSLSRMVPKQANYLHDKIDANAIAHITATMLGPSQTLTIREGPLVLGLWQAIMLCEFDGSRAQRKVMDQVVCE